MSSMVTDPPQRHRLTVDEYYRMAEAGILSPDARIELIEGEIIDMVPIGARHAGTVNRLTAALQAAVGDRAIVSNQNPVRLDEWSEPEPDLAVLEARADFYTTRHPLPADVLLIIEVADASAAYDRNVKLPLYARHRIPEVWIVDLDNRRLTRYRDPREGTYARTDSPALDAPLAIGGMPGSMVDLTELFAW